MLNPLYIVFQLEDALKFDSTVVNNVVISIYVIPQS